MSHPAVIGVALALSAVAMGTVMGWLAAAVIARLVRPARLDAVTRARLLAQARLLPLAGSILLAGSQLVAFVRYDVGVDERLGPLVVVTAICGAWLVIDAAGAGVRGWRHTGALVHDWRRTAAALHVPGWAHRAWLIRRRFPVVAVAGVLRPQLFVASQVTTACSTREMAAIAAHESAHVRALDNLLRLLFRLTPGVRLTPRLANAIESAWVAAAEQAADLHARRSAPAVELASALTKVARMAAGRVPEAMPMSGLIGGEALEARVHRLLAAPEHRQVPALAWLPLLMILGATVLLHTTSALTGLYEAFEFLLQ